MESSSSAASLRLEQGNSTVLFVESDAGEQALPLTAFLHAHRHPYHIVGSTSFEDARQLRSRAGFDVLLIDASENVPAAVDFIGESPDVPAVCLVAGDNVADAVRLMKAGAREVLVKDDSKDFLELIPIAFRQVLERAQAREALGESEARFKSAFEHAAIGLALIHPEGRWLRVNRSLCSIVGYSQVEMLCKTFQSITHLEDLDAEVENMTGLLQGNADVYQMEKRFLHRSGHSVWTQVVVSLLRGRNEHPLHFIAQVQDISQRKHTQLQLQAAKEAAEQANRAKGDFVAKISHELRTPLNGVIGTCELLLESGLNMYQRELASTARLSADSLLDVVNEVLDFSKIEAGKITIEHAPVDLLELVDDTISILSSRLHGTRTELSYSLDLDVPPVVMADAGKLRQVLVNLAGNAIKFTPDGDVFIRVRKVVEPNTGDEFIRIAVHDTGIGITPEQQARLFQAFEQADSSTTRKYGGTGLGLAICKGIVQAMHGKIGVDSSSGEGSEFWFTFPCEEALDAGGLEGEEILSGLKVLVCHRSPVAARQIACQLERGGAIVKTGFDAEGVDFDPDVQLVDDAAETNGMIEDCPTVFLASRGLSESAGKRVFVLKPVRWTRLIAAIHRAMNPPAANEGPESAPEPALGPAGGAAQALARPHPMRILIAEDNAVNQLVLRSHLHALGMHAGTAENGRIALEMHSSSAYDCILMDCHMPELDGYETTRRIRAMAGVPALAFIVAVTANVSATERAKCLASGMDAYLAKPFTRDELRTIMEAAWEHVCKVNPGTSSEASLSIELDDTQLETLRSISRQTGRNMLEEVAEIFSRTTPKLLEEIAQLDAARDFAALTKAAHKLKGSCMSAAVATMHTHAILLETAAANQDSGSVKALLKTLSQQVAPAVAVLRAAAEES